MDSSDTATADRPTLASILAGMLDPGEDFQISEARVDAYLDGVTDDALAEKVDAIAGVVKDLDSLAEGRREEAKRLTASAQSLASRVGYLKFVLHGVAEKFGGKLRGKVYRVSVAGNGGKAPLVAPDGGVYDEAHAMSVAVEHDLDMLIQTKRNISTEAVRAMLDEHGDNPDHPIHAIAKLGERGTHTRIS